jgi:hypothetical protein
MAGGAAEGAEVGHGPTRAGETGVANSCLRVVGSNELGGVSTHLRGLVDCEAEADVIVECAKVVNVTRCPQCDYICS